MDAEEWRIRRPGWTVFREYPFAGEPSDPLRWITRRNPLRDGAMRTAMYRFRSLTLTSAALLPCATVHIS
jgi:hypothetical protein